MRLGMMQPYFLPYLGYFSLIEHSDVFVLFDRAQFIRHGWVDRNRILKPSGDDWQYVRVPLRSSPRETPIAEKQIDNRQPWRERILGQIEHYRRRAPHYQPVRDLLRDVLDADHDTIAALNRVIIQRVCAYIGIATEIIESSSLALNLPENYGPGDWALATCHSLPGVDAYCNPIGGRHLFDPAKYEASAITLEFLESALTPYPQLGGSFQPGLSIIDVMLFNSIADVRHMLREYRIHPA